MGYAEQLGLDVDRFRDHMRRGAGAEQIDEDVDSADLSGVSGTPTFFINGRRHNGAYDLPTLSAEVRVARARTLVAPARWIANNAGAEGNVVVSRIAELEPGHGYNAATGEYGDLVAQGIIDPVKVTRSAVQNAASIAGMLLTTEALVVEKPEEEENAEGGHGHSH